MKRLLAYSDSSGNKDNPKKEFPYSAPIPPTAFSCYKV